MAVPTFDAFSQATHSGSPATSKTWSHTVAGSNRVLYVFAWNNNGGQATAAEYASTAMTKIYNTSATLTHFTIWRLIAPATGTHDIVVTFPTNDPSNNVAGFGAISLNGVDQTTSEDVAVDYNSGSDDTAENTITTVTGDCLILAGSAHGTADLSSVGAGETQRWTQQHSPTQLRDSGSHKDAADIGNATCTHTYGASNTWEMALIAVRSVNPPPPSDLAINIYDTVTITESVSAQMNLGNISVSDTVTITESVSAQMNLGDISVYDTVTITESVSADVMFDVSVYDTVTITESVSAQIDLGGISVYDTVTITESVSASIPFLGDISVYDTVTITESVSADMVLDIFVYDNITITEFFGLEFLLSVSVYDTVTITESVSAQMNLGDVSVYDTVTITESVSVNLNLGDIFVFDSIVITENLDIDLNLSINVSESITITESVSAQMNLGDVSVYDTVTITESVSSVVHAARSSMIHLRSTQQNYPLALDSSEGAGVIKLDSYEQKSPLPMDNTEVV